MITKKASLFVFTAILLLLTAAVFARGAKDSSSAKKTIQVTGTVRLVGTAIFPEIVITAESGEWYIASGETEKLFNLQRRAVTVEGEETIIEIKYTDGSLASIRRELRNAVVVQVAVSN